LPPDDGRPENSPSAAAHDLEEACRPDPIFDLECPGKLLSLTASASLPIQAAARRPVAHPEDPATRDPLTRGAPGVCWNARVRKFPTEDWAAGMKQDSREKRILNADME